jgi:cell wall-associated NlpC family hydrolase
MPLPHPLAALAVGGAAVLGSGTLVATLSHDHGVAERAAVAYVAAARSAPCPLDYRILVAVGAVETGHGTHAGAHLDDAGKMVGGDGGVSSAGALGPMQFMPATWDAYKVDGDGDGTTDIDDIDDAAAAAAALLCASNVDENVDDAVWSYNHDSRYVDDVTSRAAALPPDDGSAAGAAAPLPDDEGRICGVGEWTTAGNDCVDEARQKAAYLWAQFGRLLDEGDTPQFHAAWVRLNGAAPAAQMVSSTGAPSARAAQVVAVAVSWVGRQFNPGETAQCAYWVREVLDEVGVSVGVTAKPIDGYSSGEGRANSFGPDQGAVIESPDQLRPGDIVMFANTYGNFAPGDITHVGIYVGGGDVVDRPTAEAPVKRRPISTFAHFAGAVRLGGLT